MPEVAIAYNYDFIIKLYNTLNLNIIKPIYYGSWSGRKDALSSQDIIIDSKG